LTVSGSTKTNGLSILLNSPTSLWFLSNLNKVFNFW
jgi:hypothetical protein